MEKRKQFKLFKILFLLVVFMFVAVVAAGCDKPGEEPVKYTVTFKVDGVVVSTKTVEKASDLVVPANPTKAGYTFKHWALDGATTKYNMATALTANITLIAIFEQDAVESEKFIVTFVVEGEDDVEVEVEDGQKVERPEDPVKDGYTFTDWFVGEEGSEVAYDFDEPVTADLTLTAKFEEIVAAVWEVSFNVDGSITGTEVNDGDPVARPDNPTKEGYVFVEWQLNGATYNFGAPVRANIELKALFAEAVVVTFNIDGNLVTETIAINTTVSRPADPTKEDFLFDDWYLGEEVYNFAAPVTGDITITAKFNAAVTYAITYELNGGTNGDNPATHKNTTALVLKEATKADAAFVGWFDNAELTGNAITEIEIGNTADVKLYAKWDNRANITYNLNGGQLTVAGIAGRSEKTRIYADAYKIHDWTGHQIFVSTARAGLYWSVMGFKATSIDGVYELVGKGTGFQDDAATFYISYHGDCTSQYKDTLIEIYNSIAVGALLAVQNIPAEPTKTANIELNFLNGTLPGVATDDVTNILTAPYSSMLSCGGVEHVVRPGYKFLGWCLQPDTSDDPIKVYSTGYGGKEVTYYAKWIAARDITYVLDGGNNDKDNPAYFVEADLPVVLKDASKAGYTFEGWFTEATFDNEITQITEFADIILYAQFTIINYDITYVLNEGTNSPSNPATYKVTDPTITLANPTRDAYRFLGWYTEATFDNKVTEIATGSTENKTFHANWELIVDAYITYVLDGGDNHANNPASFKESDMPVTLENASKLGYTFDGWFTEATFANQITQINKLDDITVYAKFTIIEYNINYTEGEGATNPASNPTKYTVITETITFAPATKEGYIFLGWFTAAEGGTKVTKIEKGSIGEVNLFAQWQIISTYNITYNLNGALANHEDNPASHSNGTALVLQAITKDGSIFTGWYNNAALTGDPITTIPVGHTGDVELWAGWISPFTLTYNLDGGHWKYATREAMVNDFLDDFTAFYNANASSSLGRMTLLKSGDPGYDGSKAFIGRNYSNNGNVGNFFNHANYKDKWMWMVEYLITVASAGNVAEFQKILNNTHSTTSTVGATRWETWGFLAGRKDGGITIADYTDATIANGFWAAHFQQTVFNYNNPLTELPTLYKDGYTFDGWYDAETGGNKVTSASTTTTLYARFSTE
ncbi:MAG: InlB B-repeat-containing protein [Bacilli bacterium]|jgi:uncharacterized repeat protein (TIGR02543 family)